MSADKRPVLWDGEFVCSSCGHRAHAEVLGRKNHRYDELELVDEDLPPDERPTAEEKDQFDKFIHETYTAEGLGVLAVVPCPKCGMRPGLKNEVRKLGLYFFVLAVMVTGMGALCYAVADPMLALGLLLAGAFGLVGRSYTFVASVLESKDRTRFSTALPKATDESASSG